MSDLPKRRGSVRLPIGAPSGSRPLKPGTNENVMPGYLPCIQYGPATRRSIPFRSEAQGIGEAADRRAVGVEAVEAWDERECDARVFAVHPVRARDEAVDTLLDVGGRHAVAVPVLIDGQDEVSSAARPLHAHVDALKYRASAGRREDRGDLAGRGLKPLLREDLRQMRKAERKDEPENREDDDELGKGGAPHVHFSAREEAGGPAQVPRGPPFSRQAFTFFGAEVPDFFVLLEAPRDPFDDTFSVRVVGPRSEEHTSEL